MKKTKRSTTNRVIEEAGAMYEKARSAIVGLVSGAPASRKVSAKKKAPVKPVAKSKPIARRAKSAAKKAAARVKRGSATARRGSKPGPKPKKN